MEDPMLIYETFNKLEGVLWFAIALALPFSIRPRTLRQILSIAAAALGFILFGISDFLEAPLQGQLPAWLWIYKIACAAFILSCRFSYIGWQNFHLSDRYVLVALFCLLASAAAIYLQYRLYGS
jgi:hypothetical protein